MGFHILCRILFRKLFVSVRTVSIQDLHGSLPALFWEAIGADRISGVAFTVCPELWDPVWLELAFLVVQALETCTSIRELSPCVYICLFPKKMKTSDKIPPSTLHPHHFHPVLPPVPLTAGDLRT